MSKNFLFIDDSGSKEWETPYSRTFIDSPPIRNEQNLNFWRRNYFVLAGLHLSSECVAKLNPRINQVKDKYFGTKYVEIKSDWMRNPHQSKKHYFDPFGITEEKLKEFTEEWYSFFGTGQSDIEIQAFVLDKRFYRNKRGLCSPLQVTTQVLFDRVELHPHKECCIVFDQMDNEIQSERNHHGQILKISKKEINLGSFHEKYSHIKPRFEKSLNSNFLQLADTVAYNVLRQFIDYGDVWDDKNAGELKMYPFFQRIAGNFYHKNGRVAGIGIVKIPDPSKQLWGKVKNPQKQKVPT